MTATLHRFRSKKDQLTDNQAGDLRQLLLDFSMDKGLPQRAISKVLGSIDQRTSSASGWTFIMLSPQQNEKVLSYLFTHSKRPMIAMRLWGRLFTALRIDTGEICLTRAEIAEYLGVAPRHVSSIMTELEGINAITRKRAGRGVRYYMNPNVATNRTGRDRDIAQNKTGKLTFDVVEGGKP